MDLRRIKLMCSIAESMVLALYTTLHWRCSPQHNSHLVLPFIRIRHPYISVHFQIFLHYINLFHKTTGLYIQKNKTLEAPDHQTVSSACPFQCIRFLKRKNKSAINFTSWVDLTDVKLRTSPLLEMVRMWMCGTALRERQYGILASAPPLKHVPARYAQRQPIPAVSMVTALWGGFAGVWKGAARYPVEERAIIQLQ